jgi:hypothetical protein
MADYFNQLAKNFLKASLIFTNLDLANDINFNLTLKFFQQAIA